MGRGGIARSRSWARRGLGVLVLLAVLLAIVAMAPIRHPSTRYRTIEIDGEEAVPSASVPNCAALISNASLDSTYSGIYSNLPNITQNYSGAPNETAPVGQSGYPSVAVGGLELQIAWSNVCQSAAFQSTYHSEGAGAFQTGYALNGSTGYYQASYGFAWVIPCASAVERNDTCERSIVWYVDLATGGVNGPVTTNWGNLPLPGAAPGPGSSWTQVVSKTLDSAGTLGVGAIVAALALGLIGVGVASRQRGRARSLPIHDPEPDAEGSREELGLASPGTPRTTSKSPASTTPVSRADPSVRMNLPDEDPLADVY